MTAVTAVGAPRPRTATRRLVKRLAGLAVLVTLLGGWALLLRPTVLGGPASYLVVAGVSMEPHLHTGDFVIVHAAADYGNGDVVAYPVPDGQPGAGSIVIHRIIGGSGADGFVVQGDNKERPDPWQPTEAEIIGKSWFEIPGSGRYLLALRSGPVVGVVLGLAATFMAYRFLGRASRSAADTAKTDGSRWPQ